MSPHRHPNLVLILMCAIAALALTLVANTRIFPAIIGAVLLAHLLLNFRLPGKPRLVLSILLAVPFALWYRYLPAGALVRFGPIDLLIIIACYALASGVYHLLTSATGGNRNQTFAAAIIAFALAGTAAQSASFIPLIVAFVLLVLIHLRHEIGLATVGQRRAQALRYALALALLAFVATGTQLLLATTVPRVNRWLSGKLLEGALPSGVGFTRTAKLGSVSDFWGHGGDSQIMIRHWRDHASPATAESPDEPDPVEYLRGGAYDRYDHGIWQAIPENNEITTQMSDAGRNVFNIGALQEQILESLEPAGTIYPERELGAVYFLPMGVRKLSAFADKVFSSPALTVTSHRMQDGQPSGGYVYYEPRGNPPPPLPQDKHVPSDLELPLQTLAQTILDPKATPQENARRIAIYFEKNFQYHMGIQLTHPDKDPVIEFLEDIKVGHCEYFASAGALLLRTVGVPARYVTGFVCQEPSIGGYYKLARRKDAHAWVEMYVAGRGWVTFDPTPSNARPAAVRTTTSERVSELLASWWRTAMAVLEYGGVLGTFAVVWSLFIALLLKVPIPVWAVIVAGSLAWVYRKSLLRVLRPRRARPVTPRVKALRAKLQHAEKLVAVHGLVREPGTAVGAFLRQVREAPLPEPVKAKAQELLCEYQATRFRPE